MRRGCASDAPRGREGVPLREGTQPHFYTGSAQERDYLQALGTSAPRPPPRPALPRLGHETIAFWAVMPQNASVPGLFRSRVYNNRASEGDPNHRLMDDPGQRAAMMVGWVDEGVQLCAAG